ncbi:hypothetical protein NEMIN01_2259 [Nematocida minor]|uniref:uncharacterized protein n=1 Tax=Nematocida minor TaxID=1912983 RepID=UPI00221E4292|nr:uncharacterized protein NEMIN01_2259 [Nematocida minor]KAI5192879.1 hypothetical protein NEMIN01_2259 [Nematocida minor]
MILQRILKKVAIGLATLAYLKKASCNRGENMIVIKNYWNKRLSSMKLEIQIRKDFLDEAESFKCKEITSETLSNYLEVGKKNLSNIEEKLAALNPTIQEIIEKTDYLRCFDSIFNFNEEMPKPHDNLRHLLLTALNKVDSVREKIKIFDSHMLEVIEEYSSKSKNKNRKVHELTLFKLAKSDKTTALNMIYTLFRIEPYKQNGVKEDKIRAILGKAYCYIFDFIRNFCNYSELIKIDANKGEVDLLALADKHLPMLFSTSAVDRDLVDIYLSLLKEDLSKQEINQHANITPEQVIKLIMIEFQMTGCLTDYRKNNLFSNLGKVIVNIGRPTGGSINTQKDMQIARNRQDKILDVLHTLWSSYSKIRTSINYEDFIDFCEKNDISIFNLKTILDNFESARWMYKLNIASPSAEELAKDRTLLNRMCFDMSYIHPMFYIYQRFEDKSYLVEKNPASNENPFSFENSECNFLRPYKISEKDDDLVKVENIKNCIRAWFLVKNITIFSRTEDVEEYKNITDDFKEHLEKSPYIKEAEIYITTEKKTDKNKVSIENPSHSS